MSAHMKMGKRAWIRAAGLTAAIVAAGAAMAAPHADAVATRATVYNNIPTTLPGNVPSVGFEATSTSELGAQVKFDGTARTNPTVKFVMSSWACQRGTVDANNCSTTPGATFQHPITVKVYKVKADNQPGRLIGMVTKNFAMPYRPSANFTKCSGTDAGKWFKNGSCFNGFAFAKTVSLGSLDLPNKAIVSISYDTSHYGEEPTGTPGPYDSLNVGTSASAATVGQTLPTDNDAYQSSTWAGGYCDGGADGTGTFRLDAGCWTGFQPALQVTAS